MRSLAIECVPGTRHSKRTRSISKRTRSITGEHIENTFDIHTWYAALPGWALAGWALAGWARTKRMGWEQQMMLLVTMSAIIITPATNAHHCQRERILQ